MIAEPVERPRDLGALVNETAAGYQRGFPVLGVLGVLPSLPNVVYAILAGPSLGKLSSPTFHPTSASDLTPIFTAPGFIAGGIVAALLVLVAGPFLWGAIYAAALEVVEGRPASVEGALRACASAYLSIWGLLFILFVAIAGLVITCIGIPFAVYVGVRWALALPALFHERRGATAALGTSWEIVRGNWWRTFGLLLLVGLSAAIASSVVSGVVSVLTLAMPEASRLAVQSVVGAVVGAFITPVTVLFSTLLYFDLRARRLAAARL